MELHRSSNLYKALGDVTMIVTGEKGKRMYNSQHFSHCNYWIDNLIGQSAEWLGNATDIFSYNSTGFKHSSKWATFM